MKVTCIPAFNPADKVTFTVDANGTSVPLRPASYCRKTAAAEAVPTQHYTIVFTCFVLLQWFNQINARKIHGEVCACISSSDRRFAAPSHCTEQKRYITE